MDKEEILELLKDWEFINPELTSDGHGEFPYGYKLTESNLKRLSERIDKHIDDKPHERLIKVNRKQLNTFAHDVDMGQGPTKDSLKIYKFMGWAK